MADLEVNYRQAVSTPLQGLLKRRLLPIIESRMAEEPVILVQGPRSVGKSTLLRGLAFHHGHRHPQLTDLCDVDGVTDRRHCCGGRTGR